LHIRARLDRSFFRIDADLVQASNLLVRQTKVLAYAGIFRHAHKVVAATKSVPAAALPSHPLPFPSALTSLPAELARAASVKSILAAAHLMLALTRIGPLWGAILGPTNNRRRQQNHKP